MAAMRPGGLKFGFDILRFEMKPSIGILAAGYTKFGMDIRSFREPLTRAVKEVMIPSIRENFDEGGRPDKWDPLADYTLQRRADEGISGDKPLIKTGKLRRRMGNISIWSIDSEKAEIHNLPSDIWYGKLHQMGFGSFGARITRHMSTGLSHPEAVDAARAEADAEFAAGANFAAHMPQRRFVLIQEPEDTDAIKYVFQKWLKERWIRSGAVGAFR